jgi:hypothetical protein
MLAHQRIVWESRFLFCYAPHMKTIAISIDEPTLKRIDRLKADLKATFKSRSDIIRQAAQEFVSRLESLAEADREREIFRRNRKRLGRQSLELIKEQAKS